ncbi:MAG TPA: AAA family ATPase [Thermoplasmata archaeon]|nr:AAA family ATPase [Thermoplasmata archaeon]
MVVIPMAAEAGSDRPFVGRAEVVEALARRIADARSGAGGVTLLVGDAGVGKSALVEQVVRDGRGRGLAVVVGRTPAVDDPPPFSLVRSAFASARDDPKLGGREARPLGGDPMLIGFAPRMGEEAPPDLVSVEQRLIETLASAEDAGRRSQERVLASIAEQFVELARRGPTVLVLEDLYRADESSLAAVEYLSGLAAQQSLWILATSRPYPSLAGPARSRMEEFERASHAQTVVLRPFTSGEVVEFLRTIEPGRTFPASEALRRFTETGGNPLLLLQLDHRSSTGASVPTPVPLSLPRLDRELQRVLDVASVLGPQFGFTYLFHASGEEDEERFTEVVDELVGRGLLVERPGEVFAFSADRLREEAYARLGDRQRQLLHWSAGETLEGSGAAGVATIYALARHFYLGRGGAKSVKYNRLAAEIADRALASEVARDHLLHALESERALTPPDVEAESELVLELARVAEGLGRLAEAERTLREFLDGEKDDPRLSPVRRASLQIFLARVLTDRGELPAASELARAVLATSGFDHQPLVPLGAHHQLGQALYYEGRYAEALAHHTEELRLAREVGNSLLVLRAQVWRLATLSMMGPTEQVIAEAREVTATRDQLGSERESAQAHLFFGDLLADARCPPAFRAEAVAEYARAIHFAELANDPRRLGWASYKTAELLRESGRPEEAAERLETACEVFRQIGDRVGLSMSIKVRAQMAMDQKAYEVAETHLREAQELLQGLDHRLEEIEVLLRFAQLALARGDAARAQQYASELDRLDLPTARPDLADEFGQLRQTLREPTGRSDAA